MKPQPKTEHDFQVTVIRCQYQATGKPVNLYTATCPYCGQRLSTFNSFVDADDPTSEPCHRISTFGCSGHQEYPDGIIVPNDQLRKAKNISKEFTDTPKLKVIGGKKPEKKPARR